MSGRTLPRHGVDLCPPHRAPWPGAAPGHPQLATIAVLAHRLRSAGAGGRTDTLSLALAALEATLNVIEVPVFVLDDAGLIVHGNAQGRIFFDDQRALVMRSLDRAVNGESAELTWKLSAIAVDGAPWHLAVLGTRLPAAGDKRVIAAAVGRWRLTTRQRQVLELVALGLTNADIGLGLDIGECTVEFHLSAIFDKVGVDNRATLIARLLAL